MPGTLRAMADTIWTMAGFKHRRSSRRAAILGNPRWDAGALGLAVGGGLGLDLRLTLTLTPNPNPNPKRHADTSRREPCAWPRGTDILYTDYGVKHAVCTPTRVRLRVTVRVGVRARVRAGVTVTTMVTVREVRGEG